VKMYTWSKCFAWNEQTWVVEWCCDVLR